MLGPRRLGPIINVDLSSMIVFMLYLRDTIVHQESVIATSHALNEEGRKVEEFANSEIVNILREEDVAGHTSTKSIKDKREKQCHRNAGKWCIVMIESLY